VCCRKHELQYTHCVVKSEELIYSFIFSLIIGITNIYKQMLKIRTADVTRCCTVYVFSLRRIINIYRGNSTHIIEYIIYN